MCMSSGISLLKASNWPGGTSRFVLIHQKLRACVGHNSGHWWSQQTSQTLAVALWNSTSYSGVMRNRGRISPSAWPGRAEAQVRRGRQCWQQQGGDMNGVRTQLCTAHIPLHSLPCPSQQEHQEKEKERCQSLQTLSAAASAQEKLCQPALEWNLCPCESIVFSLWIKTGLKEALHRNFKRDQLPFWQ